MMKQRMRRSISILLIGVGAFSPGLMAQPAAKAPAFDVASIKPSPPTGMLGYLTYPGGRVRCGHCTLEMLIKYAFDVQAFQISGGPGWIHTERYEIDARVPPSSKSSKAHPSVPNAPMTSEQRVMLATLLANRFQLQFHRETRTGGVYFLVKGNKPLKLTPSNPVSDFPWVGSFNNGDVRGDGIGGKSVTMPILAFKLSQYMGRPVIDRTGIKGFYDFEYRYLSDDPHPDVISTIVTSVQELGLKLESGKGPVETIVIDHAEMPSPN
jgi:uncharacterized protein (TIGR03435 family)